MKYLRMAPKLALPIHAITESIGILAKRRAGKSTTARRLTEQIARARQQVVVIDPKGDWWGLRYSRDGKKPGLPFVVMGGEHKDVALESGGGELVARLVVTDRVSVILDLSEFRRDDRDQFITAFMETLYRLKAQEKFRTPVMLVIDEADLIAPQKPIGKYSSDMVGAATDLVRRGGQRGIGVTMISQRSASISKEVLTQLGILIILQTIAPQDRKAIEAWVDVHGTPEQARELMTSLPTLERGNGWIWAPGFPKGDGLFERHHFLLPETFDSSKTPEAGKRLINPKRAAKVDLAAFQREMAATIKAADDSNPAKLHMRIRNLERELAIERAKDPAKPYAPLKSQHVRRLEDSAKRLERVAAAVTKATTAITVGLSKAMPPEPGRLLTAPVGTIETPEYWKTRRGSAKPEAPLAMDATSRIRQLASESAKPDRYFVDFPVKKLSPGERALLTAIANNNDGVTLDQLAVLAPKIKRSSRYEYARRLKQRQLINNAGDLMTATSAGIAALGADFRPVPTSSAQLREHLLNTLPAGERAILGLLIREYPGALTREQIEAATAFKRSSTYEYLRRLITRKAVDNEGVNYRAGASLFGRDRK